MAQPARNGGMSSPAITLRYWMRHPGYGRVSSSSRPTTRRLIWSIAGNTHSKVHRAGERKLTADRVTLYIMGDFTIGGWLRALGWLSTAAMAACVVGMVLTWLG